MKTTTTKILPTSPDDDVVGQSKSSSASSSIVKEPVELQQAGEMMKALYEIHDFFFSADKTEKRVGR